MSTLYAVSAQRYDEALREDGTLRPAYGPVIDSLSGRLRSADVRIRRKLAEGGVEFGPPDSRAAFVVDPVPRLFTADEWSLLEAGLIQRMAALERFITDAYGPRAVVEAGVLPGRVLEESRYYEPLMATSGELPRAWVAGPDIVRDRDGTFWVLEDNTRSPSGLTYALASRRVVRVGEDSRFGVRSLNGALATLHRTLRSADPRQGGEPSIAVLTDGESSTAWYEHQEIAERLNLPLVTPAGLSSRSGRLRMAGPGGVVRPIDVLYNRSSQESLRDENGSLFGLGEILAEPLKKGSLHVVNSFGMGIADDKAVFCYFDSMVRYYLGEEPILPCVPTFDLGEPAVFAEQSSRLDELVIKPRWSFGGHGVVLGPEATSGELRRVEHAVRAAPDRFVAQEPIDFSVHPTVTDDRLEPRHVDFRPFVFNQGGKFEVMSGGLTRFAGERGSRIVNSTQGGGAKDTWVLR